MTDFQTHRAPAPGERVLVRCADDVRRFVNALELRENFFIEFTETPPKPGFAGAGHVVWSEGPIERGETSFQFHYDDGHPTEFDHDDEPIEGTNDYPDIVCTAEQIVSLERIGKY